MRYKPKELKRRGLNPRFEEEPEGLGFQYWESKGNF
jgi:hypothetical protein